MLYQYTKIHIEIQYAKQQYIVPIDTEFEMVTRDAEDQIYSITGRLVSHYSDKGK